mgnify:CR=1 FL=1
MQERRIFINRSIGIYFKKCGLRIPCVYDDEITVITAFRCLRRGIGGVIQSGSRGDRRQKEAEDKCDNWHCIVCVFLVEIDNTKVKPFTPTKKDS